MTKQEFLDLEDAAQLKYLNGEAAKGISFNEISAGINMSKKELEKIGFYFVKDKFMQKPMKGYQTTKRSGNEEKI